MKNDVQTEPGSPRPKGALVLPHGINFALFSRHAESVTLVLDPCAAENCGQGSFIELALDPSVNKTGDIWHVLVRGLPHTFYYGYRLGGPNDPEGTGHNYDEGRILIDPYAKALRPAIWGGTATAWAGSPAACCPMPGTTGKETGP